MACLELAHHGQAIKIQLKEVNRVRKFQSISANVANSCSNFVRNYSSLNRSILLTSLISLNSYGCVMYDKDMDAYILFSFIGC